MAQAGNKLVSLCEQELIDCCAPCNGAGPGVSWDWLINNTQGLIDTEASYPYKGDKPKGTCRPPTAVAARGWAARGCAERVRRVHGIEGAEAVQRVSRQGERGREG